MVNINTTLTIDNLLDIHTHILPEIDDGPKDVEISKKMVENLKEQGVSTIVLTPHFCFDDVSVSEFLQRREKSFNNLSKSISNFDEIKFLKGAEVLITPSLLHLENIFELCIEGTNFILLEIPFSDMSTRKALEAIEHIISQNNVIPIIAHVDRYKFFFEKKSSTTEELLNMGCFLQINADSLLDKSSKKTILKQIGCGNISFIGSDAHNLTDRAPNISSAYRVIVDYFGEENAKLFNNSAKSILFP